MVHDRAPSIRIERDKKIAAGCFTNLSRTAKMFLFCFTKKMVVIIQRACLQRRFFRKNGFLEQ